MKRQSLAAALWGFAEATVFFIVPDVLLSFILLRSGLRRALLAALVAAVAAMAGGALIMLWAARAPDAAHAVIVMVPNISEEMLSMARAGLAQDGVWEMLRGAFAGVPYKVYALEARPAGLSPLAVLGATIPVRFIRFAATLAVVAMARAGLTRVGLAPRLQMVLLAVAWTLFYVWFFAVTPE